MQKELTFGPRGRSFFSNCTILLRNIIDSFNYHKQLPEKINNENMFSIINYMIFMIFIVIVF
jgi:hypothetical protein